MKKFYFLKIVFFLFFTFCSVAADEIAQIKQRIKDKNVNWTTQESWVTKLSPEERKNLLGAIINPSDSELAPLISLPPTKNLPPELDWRDNNGNWITPVKNQANCGSCWDFSAIGQVEAWWKIYNTNLDSMIDLSEQFILSCGNAGSCAGGSAALALEFVKNTGVPSEACFPYYADDTVPCSSACGNWINEAVTIPGWGWITTDEAIVNNIKNAVFIHPLSTFIMVYTDLIYYSGGVYQYVWGQQEGGHLVVIVGWNDTEQSWICKNSWNTTWGDSGYFRIRWGECNIGTWSPFIWNDVAGGSVISVFPNQFDLSLSAGDTVVQQLTITNNGQNLLEYSAIDYGSKILFHNDDFSTWDSLSWWCGDSSIGGYYNNCLQYLDSPILDLSNTTSPILTWMGLWALEDPTGVFPPYDGWDGCNVWVSTDGGDNFDIAYPTTPLYDCNHLYSFSNPSGWNLGVIPGWVGINGTWTPIEFDLSSYKTDSVIIRFAFASDEGFCTLDDPSIFGFLVDDIKVFDGNTTIFEDDANDFYVMNKIGYGYTQADWIDIPSSVGQIHAYDSAIVDINIDARNLVPGDYFGSIVIVSNDTVLSEIEIPFQIEVIGPAGIDNLAGKIHGNLKLQQNYPNPFNPSTAIEFSLPNTEFVTLKIYNLLGQEVATLVSDKLTPGNYKYTWDAAKFASGVYYYKIQTSSFVQTKKLIVLK